MNRERTEEKKGRERERERERLRRGCGLRKAEDGGGWRLA